MGLRQCTLSTMYIVRNRILHLSRDFNIQIHTHTHTRHFFILVFSTLHSIIPRLIFTYLLLFLLFLRNPRTFSFYCRIFFVGLRESRLMFATRVSPVPLLVPKENETCENRVCILVLALTTVHQSYKNPHEILINFFSSISTKFIHMLIFVCFFYK